MFRNTSEILLLLIVLFSVIIMGVQNAIDRESINAIIGGIVGYVAGRVTSKTPKLADILSAVNNPPQRGSTTTTITTSTETDGEDDEEKTDDKSNKTPNT